LGIGLALFILSLASSLWAIYAILFILGMAAGFHIPSAIATITAMVNRQDWGKALAVHQTAPPLSLVVGPLLAILLLSWFSWQTIMAILGGISIAVGLAFLRFGRCGDFPGHAPRPADVKVVISKRSFWIMVVLFALAMGGSVGIYTMLPLFLVNERGFDRDLANTLLGLSRVSGLFMAFIAGWFTDRLGEKTFIFIIMLTAGVSTIMLGALSGMWLLVIIFVQPAILGCYFTAGFAALARIVQPNFRNIAAAFTMPTAFLFGGGLLPTVIGYMGEVYSFGLGIVMIGCLTVVVSWLVLFLDLIEKMEEGC
jgi:NNP family nitrate/nitrite transporter-like MFS transporter